MPINVAIKYSRHIKSEFFVPLSPEKRVKIQHGDSEFKLKLEKYKEKGLGQIIFAEEDYFDLLKSIKNGLVAFFLKDKHGSNKNLDIHQIMNLVKKAETFIGVDKVGTEERIDLTLRSLKWLKQSPVLRPLINVFQKDNQDEFFKNILIGHICVAIIEKLGWTTPQIKEKAIQAVILSDITLSEKDIAHMILSQGVRKQYTPKILNHPKESAELLLKSKGTVAREVARAIEQHHEHPNGSGYPLGVKNLTIDRLSAVVIVARVFIDTLVDSEFAYDDRKKFITDISGSFLASNFITTCKGLNEALGIKS
jgi:hypothetical protein